MISSLLFLAALPCALAAGANNTTSATALRILPVGASVTFGVGSSTGNSYRLDLRTTLVSAGHEVNYVGRHRNGNFTDNQVEATSGFVLSQIAEAARTATPMFLPNLVLIEAGTNNCNSGKLVPDAGANLTALINDIFTASPGVTVVAATLLANKVAAQDACRVDVNKQYQAMATSLEGQNKKFVLVDMRSPEGPTTSDLFDSRHPNDRGYVKMATVWGAGIKTAVEKGFIGAPKDNGTPLNGESKGSTGSTSPVGASAAMSSMSVVTAGAGEAMGASVVWTLIPAVVLAAVWTGW
ncbi:carbohydrate esterase family 3 protein [Echria macrotheca]|uniref:Carbohydrate esterase family 3 protein n=1 Tax=Echria macrotheca TaxID=438768 RepID=A0AAJ0B332_9PEZI|nr:carbohydrate esterase family 3 protein [Echria macrotheca]